MNHILAGCGKGVSQSCSQYATSSWSGGGILFGLVLILIVVAVIAFARRRRG